MPDIAHKKLLKEIDMGRIAGPFPKPPFDPFHISPLNLREKKQKGQFRLIHNLSYPYDSSSINSNIPDSSKKVHYTSVRDAIKLLLNLPHGAYTAKTDIRDAFRIIPIRPEDHPKLGICFQKRYYYDKCLPQGCASSCYIFETFTTAIQNIFLSYYPHAKMLHMLDDFLILAATSEECDHLLKKFLCLCEHIGIPMAPDKTTPPSRNTIFLGIELDTVSRAAKLPLDKILEYKSSIEHYLKKDSITKAELETLVGKLNFAASVVPARPFLRRLYDHIHPHQKPFHYVRLNSDIKRDLYTWHHFLAHYNGITYFRALDIITSDSIPMVTDACHKGFGGYFGHEWIQCQYPSQWSVFHITVLELFPIYVLISMYGPKLTNSHVLLKTDNSAVRDVINSQTCKNNHVMQIIRPLVLVLISYNIRLTAQHVPGSINTLADCISRFKVSPAMLQEHHMDPFPVPVPQYLQPTNFRIK